MSEACGCFRFWLDDDEDPTLGAREREAEAQHLVTCADCRREARGIALQRAALRAALRSERTPAPLSEDLVARCVRAMRGSRGAEALDERSAAG